MLIYRLHFISSFYIEKTWHKITSRLFVVMKVAGNLLFTRQRITQSASWIERSASSSTSLLLPRTTTQTVRPAFWIPVIRTTFEVPVCVSSTKSAVARVSAVKWSKEAAGLHPKPYVHVRKNKTIHIYVINENFTFAFQPYKPCKQSQYLFFRHL